MVCFKNSCLSSVQKPEVIAFKHRFAKGGRVLWLGVISGNGRRPLQPTPVHPVTAPSSEWMNFSKWRVGDSCLTHPGAPQFKADNPGSSFNFLSAPFWIDIDALEAGSWPNSSGSQIWTLDGKCGIYQYAPPWISHDSIVIVCGRGWLLKPYLYNWLAFQTYNKIMLLLLKYIHSL